MAVLKLWIRFQKLSFKAIMLYDPGIPLSVLSWGICLCFVGLMITAFEPLSVWSGKAINVSDSFLVNLQESIQKCTFILLHQCPRRQEDLWNSCYNKMRVMDRSLAPKKKTNKQTNPVEQIESMNKIIWALNPIIIALTHLWNSLDWYQ